MRTIKATLLAFLTPALLVACSADGSTVDSETNRGPIGKADAAGSCALPDGGDACGGMSDSGSCWCDDACAHFGDCCSDKASVCDDAVDLCDDFAGPCQSDDDCGEGFACEVDPDTCSPSACGCDPTTGQVICTADCGGAECVPTEQPDPCEDFVPPCQSDDDCGDGEVCGTDTTTCSPSVCGCDSETGNVFCTQDCAGKECMPDPFGNICDSFVGPCGSDDDCGDGMECVVDPTTCSPSACGCDPDTGSIICTQDCGGAECRPVADECEQPLDCFNLFGAPTIECVGATWECNSGTCNQTCG